MLTEISSVWKEGSIYSCGHSHTSPSVPHSSVFQKCWAMKLIVSSKPWSSEMRYLITLLSRVMAKLHSTSKTTELTTALEINSHTSARCEVQATHDVWSWSCFCSPVFPIFMKTKDPIFLRFKLLSFQSLTHFFRSLCPASEICFRISFTVLSTIHNSLELRIKLKIMLKMKI